MRAGASALFPGWVQAVPGSLAGGPEAPPGRRHVRNARESVGFCCAAAKEVQCQEPTSLARFHVVGTPRSEPRLGKAERYRIAFAG